MGAITADDNASSPPAVAADEIDRALTLPRALIDANWRAGATLLDFAGRQVRAETDFLERLAVSRDLGEINAAQARFVAAMIDECGAELTTLTELARESAVRFVAAPPRQRQ